MKPRMLIVMSTVLSLTAVSQADTGQKGKKLDGTKGMIVSVDSTAKSFVFRTGKKKDPNAQEITIHFNHKTKFFKLSQNGTSEVQADALTGKHRAAVVYESKNGKNVASKVTLVDLPKKKKNAGTKTAKTPGANRT
jgi:hypothetical protein